MISFFYLLAFLLSAFLMLRVLIRNKRIDSQLIFLCFSVLINNFGRYLVSTSETLEMAICANKILYFGGCFAPMMFTLFICSLCKIKLPTFFKYIAMAIPSCIYALVLTIGKSSIYYKNVQLGIGNGHNYLIKEYGSLHFLYPMFTILCLAAYIGAVIYAITVKKNVSARMLMLLCSLGFATIMTYILQRAFHSTIEWISISYLVSIFILTHYFEHVNMFDMSANIANSVEKTHQNGYIVFDISNKYIDCTAYVQELFPEIMNWKNDAFPPKNDSILCNEIVPYAISRQKDDLNDERHKTIELGGRWYELNIRDVIFSRKKVGYLVEIADRTAENKYLSAIEDYNIQLEKEVEKKTEKIVHVKDMMVLGMASMVESRDSSTGGHIRRTSKVVDIFAKKLVECGGAIGLDEEFLKKVSKAAPMHDLGKITVSDSVLRKQGRFTDEEYAEMKKHAAAGGKIVDEILEGVEDEDFVKIAHNVAMYHHEKYDGTGYPTGIKGEEIPIEARIMALADVFDALVSKRCYKDAYSYDKAFGIIKESIGSHFDPELGEVFLQCREKLEDMYNTNL